MREYSVRTWHNTNDDEAGGMSEYEIDDLDHSEDHIRLRLLEALNTNVAMLAQTMAKVLIALDDLGGK